MAGTDGTLRISRKFDRPVLGPERVVLKDPPPKRLAGTEQNLDGLFGLDAADHAGDRTQDPSLLAAGDDARIRWLPEQAAQARPSGQDG